MATTWSRRLAIFLGASLLLPITSEFVVSRITGENYDFRLALSLILIVGPIALLLYYARPVRMTARLIMSLGLTAGGLAVAALGFAMTVWPVPEGFGIPTVVIGLGVASVGALYVGRARYDVPQELPAPHQPADPNQVKIERHPPFRAGTHNPVIDMIVKAMSVDDLHYVAYHVDGRCVMTLDLLDHPQLSRFHDVVEPYQRRDEYRRHGETIEGILRRLNEEFRTLGSGDLIRLVLDVERGAIYYHMVTADRNRYLISVTLNQYKVHIADRKCAHLVDDIRVHLGQPKLTDLELPRD
ncbi:hypothetical protein [Allorhizocola rhizosphaerae]|uniref:hypothetical protein n=1 Tax=Allorhizocola rhizosphaerae TaxID=1872709 RepID=UPI000E3C9C70|nr:hypothetical protein [Allorhizocola rhizosphaerae]